MIKVRALHMNSGALHMNSEDSVLTRVSHDLIKKYIDICKSCVCSELAVLVMRVAHIDLNPTLVVFWLKLCLSELLPVYHDFISTESTKWVTNDMIHSFQFRAWPRDPWRRCSIMTGIRTKVRRRWFVWIRHRQHQNGNDHVWDMSRWGRAGRYYVNRF